MILGLVTDAIEIFIMPMYAERALSPTDDLLDLAIAAILARLLGWHWELLPAFIGELRARSRSGSVLDTVCS